MRVLLDATAIPADRGGVGRYVDALLPELAALGLELVVVSRDRDATGFAELVPDAELVVAPGAIASRPARLAWEQVGLPRIVRSVRADVLHSPHYTAPIATSARSVVTLHDATFFSHPDLHSRIKATFFRTVTRLAVRRADALVVPSAATRDAVRSYVGGAPARFHVAYHGVDPAVFHPVEAADVAAVRAKLGVGDHYVGFLGTLEPRKNVPALIRGWVRAVEDMPEPPALVLAGGPGWDERVAPAIAEVPSHLTVVRPGYLPLDELAAFLAGADVLAYPSLGEGFGLPVLEAMACGAAVLTTRELSLPEVGGDAVAYCGTDEPSIAAALGDLLSDHGLRGRLSDAAVRRAGKFTWRASAEEHLAAYRAALGT
ncbi:glycosyltransferase family 4 protein [Actinotalea sp. M2MS4P-6]|uniref:glycosyltransferase family 4 protein n=1 Tax=Actinotalea sp. M2MS4P-6 TaxID=2983762 RepID=UPI0021E46320|nr:glycosyltransferase family 1 protein [Actinotalea sp. M2MS4P-6]MCV2394175.1 glycosyltransferase family 4 protein [Actinotalea sp. M2MS4P-6]